MKITSQSVFKTQRQNVRFGAGVVNLITDYDGTYMPAEFPHDSVAKNTPPLNKKSFSDYFENFKVLLKKLKGQPDDPKLKFSISTGRNLHEFNYHVSRLKENGLSIPLPDTLITCNGGDEYFKRTDCEDYFKSNFTRAFLPQDVNQKKRDWVKEASGGWDGYEIRENLKKTFSEVKLIPNSKERNELLDRIMPANIKGLRAKSDWIYDLFNKPRTEEELRVYLEECAQPVLNGLHGKDRNDLAWFIGEMAHEIDEIKKGKYRFQILDTKTHQSNWTYPNMLTLQTQLESLNPVPKFYTAIRDDGNLCFHVAYPWVLEHKPEFANEFETTIPKMGPPQCRPEGLSKDMLTKALSSISCSEADTETFNIHGEQTSALRIRPYIQSNAESILDQSGVLSKKQDVFFRLKEIMEKGLDDLVIVAGDGTNDVEMLLPRNYINGFNVTDAEKLKLAKDLPMISIFVENQEVKGFDPAKLEKTLNNDGVVRFIRVVPNNDTGRPKTLQEGILSALQEYSKRNENFAKNLPQEVKELLEKNDYSYKFAGIVKETVSDTPELSQTKETAAAETVKETTEKTEKELENNITKETKNTRKRGKASPKKPETPPFKPEIPLNEGVKSHDAVEEVVKNNIKNKTKNNFTGRMKNLLPINKKTAITITAVLTALGALLFALKKTKVQTSAIEQVKTQIVQQPKQQKNIGSFISMNEYVSRLKNASK